MERPVQLCSLTVLRTLGRYIRKPWRIPDIERREWALWAARGELRRRGLVKMYSKRPAQVYWPDWVDLRNIYNLVRRRKPKVIFEFGSGCSTLMFAKALADNQAAGDGAGRLYSIETSEHFMKCTESYFPAELKPFVEFIHSGIEVGEMAGEPVMWHKSVPSVAPNLVYLDGPDYQDFSPTIATQADGVRLEPNAPDDFAVLIDGRLQTFEFTRANLKRKYRTTKSRINAWELLEPTSK